MRKFDIFLLRTAIVLAWFQWKMAIVFRGFMRKEYERRKLELKREVKRI